jgi:hypothetical protein
VTSREDLGRLAYAAHCDMAGRPRWPWERLPDGEQAAWIHSAVAVRDRLAYGLGHAYRPEEGTDDMARTTRYGGNEEPRITATDDAGLYARLRAEGRDDVTWTGDGPAPGSDVSRETEVAEEVPAEVAERPKRSTRSAR